MKKKLALALAFALTLSLALTGCGKKDTSDLMGKEGGTSLTFTTGGEQGTYFGFGGVLAGKISEKTSTSVTHIASGGSKANIENLQKGDAQLAFVQTDVGAYGFNGERLFTEETKYDGFSTVANLYMEQVQIVTLDPEIKTVADLKGKTVSVGDAGSGVYFNAQDVLAAYDLDIEKDINATYQSFGNSTEALQDGRIDACFLTAGAPTTAVTSLATTKDVYLVALDDEHIEKLLADSPYYSKAVIPAGGEYKLKEDVTTVAVGAVVVARDDVSDVDVYNFLTGVFGNLEDIKAAHGKGAELSLEFAASYGAVPYHPGAVEFFKENNLEVKGK